MMKMTMKTMLDNDTTRLEKIYCSRLRRCLMTQLQSMPPSLRYEQSSKHGRDTIQELIGKLNFYAVSLLTLTNLLLNRRALASTILPELFSPYIKLQLLEWEPLEEDRKDAAPFFTSMEWYEQLYDYGPIDNSSNPTPKDEDAFLIPNIVKLNIIPRLRALFSQGMPLWSIIWRCD